MLVGVGLAMIMGAAALAVDMSYAYVIENRLQITADTAAMAAINELPDVNAAQGRALEYAVKNLPVENHGTVVSSSDFETGNWDSSSRTFTVGGTPVNAVRVIARRSQSNGNALQLFFANALGMGETDVSAVAVASTGGDPVCVLALDPSSGDALTLDSNSGIDLEGCTIHVNSSHSSALSTLSNATVSADSTCIVGNYTGSGSSYTPAPETACDSMADPLAGLAEPASAPCDFNNFAEDDYTTPLNPGIYCGGLELNGNSNTTFNAGTYVISGGNFYLDSNTIVQGTGVTFFLTNGALIEFNSNTSVDFTAPTTGIYAGILFFQDPDDGGIHVLDSNISGVLEGVIYLPNGYLHSDSNTDISGSSACTMLIARRFNFNSNSGLNLDYDPSACSVPLPAGLTGGSASLVS